MSFFTWDERYRLGVSEIDYQHGKLVLMLNQLYEAMAAGRAKGALGLLFADLVHYTKEHFGTEAALMKVYKYPDAQSHATEHAMLVRRVYELQKQLEEGSATVTVQTAEFLRDWLANHILVVDRELAKYLRARGLS